MKKWLKRIGTGVGVLLIVGVILSAVLFFNEVKTLLSLKQVDSYPFYTMTYSGDYGFDDFLKVGAKSDKDIEHFVVKRLLKGIELDLNIASPACTAFSTKNPEGEVIFGRNFDFSYAPSLLVHTKPKGGYASVSMVNLSFLGYDQENLPTPLSAQSFLALAAPFLPFDGMNERGVTIALLAVPYADPPRKPDQITLNTTTGIRLVLDKAATTDEAVKLLKQYNFYFSGDVDCHYLISDASGKSVVVEFMDEEVVVVDTDKPYEIATNFIMYKGLNTGEGYNEFERFDTVEARLLENGGLITEQQAMDLLSDVQIPDRTQWSAVYNAGTKTVDICINKNYEKVYEFSMKP